MRSRADAVVGSVAGFESKSRKKSDLTWQLSSWWFDETRGGGIRV